MKQRWVVIANRANARLFSFQGPRAGLVLEESLDHEAGRLKAQAVDTDRPGRSFDSGGEGRHSMSRAEDPTEELAARFARTVAQKLREARTQGAFDELVLVAEPRFLGYLRAALDDGTAALVSDSLSKDLADFDGEDLTARLGEVLPVG